MISKEIFRKKIAKLENKELLTIFGSYFILDEKRKGNEEYKIVQKEILDRMNK